jgi:iron complex transport system permease protein
LTGALSITLLAVVVWSVGVGAMTIAVPDVITILLRQLGLSSQAVEPQQEAVLTIIRLPRVLLGVLIGAVLGVSGASLQGLFRNPLADPGLIGISSGASLFAVLTIMFQVNLAQSIPPQLGLYMLSIAAFVGATITTFLVYQLSRQGGKAVVSTMLLAGIAINALSGALTGLMTYLADDAQLRSITFWGLGSLGGATWETITVAAPFLLLPVLLLPRLGKALNAFALGESQAGHLGVNATQLKRWVILLSTLGVGVAVAISGVIGFVGLVIPHLIRMMAGADHRRVLPASALLGAIILTLADLLSRTIVAPAELPIGIITAMLGTPLFLYILITSKSNGSV